MTDVVGRPGVVCAKRFHQGAPVAPHFAPFGLQGFDHGPADAAGAGSVAPPAGEGDRTSQYAWWLMEDEPDWEVVNQGVNGERSDQILARFERDVIDHRPSAVVVIAGVNDVYQGREPSHVIEQLGAIVARQRRSAGSGVPESSLELDHRFTVCRESGGLASRR